MKVKFFGKIAKVDEQDDGTVIVEGIASTEAVDRQGEVVKAEAMKAALPDYLSTGKGPLREMHQPSAAGYVFKAEVNDAGETIIAAKVVDPVAVLKVKEGVYQGFSIGGKAIEKADGVISRLVLSEISLVDRPANPESMISMWKGDEIDGSDEEVVDESVVKADENAEPAKTEEPAASATVEKGMDEVAFAARILQQIEYLRQACEWEKECEGDASPVPDKLKEVVATLGDILASMTAEEVAEIKANAEPEESEVEMSDKTGDVAKAGARNSSADLERIQKAHDSLVELGAECECNTGKAALVEDLAKLSTEKEDAISKIASLESDLAKLADEKKALEVEIAKRDESLVIRDAEIVAKDARIKQLEALPAATKGVLRAVEKADDSVGVVKATDAVPQLKNDPLELIKALHSGVLR